MQNIKTFEHNLYSLITLALAISHLALDHSLNILKAHLPGSSVLWKRYSDFFTIPYGFATVTVILKVTTCNCP
jgi:hypothetical protein